MRTHGLQSATACCLQASFSDQKMTDLKEAARLYGKGAYEQAETLCRAVLDNDITNAKAWQLRGLIATRGARYADAADHFRQATLHDPEDAASYTNLSVALLSLGKTDEALTALSRSVELDPASPDAHLNLASCYLNHDRPAEAMDSAAHALSLRPDWPKALGVLASALLEQKDFEKAIELATRAIALDPTLAIGHRAMADILLQRRDFDGAFACFEKVLSLGSGDAKTYNNYGLLLTRLGRYDEAIIAYEEAVALAPDNAKMRHGLALVLLATGRLAEGFEHYAWRHLFDQNQLGMRVDQAFPERLPAPGEKLIAVAEQGLGDQVMLASLIPDLLRSNPDLEIHCDARLLDLFRRSFPTVTFAPFNRQASPVGSIGLADTARWLRPSLESFPRQPGFLNVDRDLATHLRTKYKGGRERPLVGLSWSTAHNVKFAKPKSLPLQDWGPILSIPGATFVNLQYGATTEEVAQASRTFGARIVTDHQIDPLVNLDAFAAQVAAMDLVITTSNTTAHFAGALNVPTWVFIPMGFGGMWHWFLEREDSPWYPSARLFRQTERGQWAPVVDRVSGELVAFLDSLRPQDR